MTLSTTQRISKKTTPADYHAQTRKEMLTYVPKNVLRTLEIGCGEGRFSEVLKTQRQGLECWGIEISAEAAAAAAKRLDRVLAWPVERALEECAGERFDCVIANDVLEHLADPDAILEKLKTLLNPGGVIVCSIPNVRYFWVLWDLIARRDWRYTDAGVLDRTHLRFFTERSLREMFTRLGFEVLTLEGINGMNSWKFSLLNAACLGAIRDTQYPQFACVVRPLQTN